MDDKRMAVALQLRRAIELLVQTAPITEENALVIADLYELWTVGADYSSGHIIKYGADDNGDTNLYFVLQQHTSAENWTPDKTHALYKRIGFNEGGIPVWVQPLGAADAYVKGDKVSHKNAVWVSDIDGNVWEPGVYGWTVHA